MGTVQRREVNTRTSTDMAKGKDREEKGPSKNQLRGLTYQDNKPAFLRNIATALSGSAPASSDRPPIPTRPGRSGDDDNDDDDEPFDNNDYGEEAPQIVVLNEGKHLTAEEAEVEKLNEADRPPIEKAQKREGTLKFASNSNQGSGSGPGQKRKNRSVGQYDEPDMDAEENDGEGGGGVGGDSFADLVKRAKVDPNAGSFAKEKQQPGKGGSQAATARATATAKGKQAKDKTAAKKPGTTKEERAAMKAKRKAAAKMLSFEE